MPSRVSSSERIRRRSRRAAHWVDVYHFAHGPAVDHYFRDPVPREFRRRPGKVAKGFVKKVLAIRVGAAIFTTLVLLRRDHLTSDGEAAFKAALDEIKEKGAAFIARRPSNEINIPTHPGEPRNVEHAKFIATRSARR